MNSLTREFISRKNQMEWGALNPHPRAFSQMGEGSRTLFLE